MTVMVDGTPVKVRNDVETPVSGQVVILGLEAGTYYLKETKAPDGYNLLPDVATVTVGTGDTAPYSNGYKTLQGEDIEYYTVYSKIVENNKGVQLPSTGGMGTMMLITFGSVIAMAFAVLMITQKKMSVYRD
jgi:LPXTG-motif cell wall-anchored protein